jgi:Cu/Zn superoxide dismutase
MNRFGQRLVMGAVSAMALVLVACGSSSSVATVTPTPTPVETPTPVASPVASPSPSGATFTLTGLGANAAITGTITITQGTGSFTVVLDVTGLAANSVHPAHIHTGASCTANGGIAIALKDVMADATGHGTSTTDIPQAYVVPATGWYINVHQGPTLDGAGATPIACGVIT